LNFLANLSVDPEVIKLSMGKKKSTCKSVVSKSASSRKLGIAFEDSSEDEGFMYRVGNSNCSLLGDKAVRNDESGSEVLTHLMKSFTSAEKRLDVSHLELMELCM